MDVIKVKALVDMEQVLMEINHQIEKLPLTYEWQLRVFLNQTMPQMACYKFLANRLLEKRYGIEKFHDGPKQKGKKAQKIRYWELDPERESGFREEIAPLEDMDIHVFVPKFDLKIIQMCGVKLSNTEVLAPILKSE